jgi:hypothetical protein
VRNGKQIRAGEDLLPDRLLLRGGEKERQLLPGVERVLPQAHDERVERQDVGRFPCRQAPRRLVGVEFRHQALRQAAVRRHHGDARGVAFAEAREQIGLRKGQLISRESR